MLKIEWLFLVLFSLVFFDFFTTLIGVGLLGFHEANPILKNLYYNKDYTAILIYCLFVTPIALHGIINLFRTQKMRVLMVKILIVVYVFTVVMNAITLLRITF